MVKEIESPTTATHLVLKLADCEKYLNPLELGNLADITLRISQGRKAEGSKDNKYLVINTDEPYAQEVKEIIDKGEARKYT